jgi:hypothetical protein
VTPSAAPRAIDADRTSAFDAAHAKVLRLVADFQHGAHLYMQPSYSEAQARKDFIDPFLKALGWDVDHERERNPYEQEVKVERSMSISGARAQKRADYAFFLAPNFHDVRFFVEAKKPSIDLDHSSDSHFQVWRYGYSAGTPLAVLTDFEQIRVVDCRGRPEPDGALDRTWKHWYYTDFIDPGEFAAFYWLFSREAHAEGSFDRRTAELPRARGPSRQRGLLPGGYQPVDESFLAELESYRLDLARMFKAADTSLDSSTLTAMVQRALDRLVFMRFLEDKQIETEVRVSDFGRGTSVWRDFINASKRMDGIYNGVVFKPEPPLDNPAFNPDDAAFAGICEALAAENSPYNFDVIPIHILGSIYERFLGSTICATATDVSIEDKPAVRRAGGVYYTPEYIVRYIVDQAVGRLLSGKRPSKVARMRFADIACGSGSFLLTVFDVLLRHEAEWYNRPENAKAAKAAKCLYSEDDGRWRLSLAQRREVLLNNIFGVDIDRQAVEVAQLSLFLKLLEDEKAVTARQYQFDYSRNPELKKLLPNLNSNIVCGNSLVDWSIADAAPLSPQEELRLNPLDLATAFRAIRLGGGFDAIVGNPPYGAELQPIERAFLSERFQIGSTDTAALMLVAAAGLTKPSGSMIGMILPKPLTYSSAWAGTRAQMMPALDTLVDVGKAWKEVKLEQSICIFASEAGDYYASLRRDGNDFVDEVRIAKSTSETFGFWLNGVSEAELRLGEKIHARGAGMGTVASNTRGAMLQSSVTEAGRGPSVIGGRHIGRFAIRPSSSRLDAGTEIPSNGRIREGSVLVQNIVAHITRPVPHIAIIATLADAAAARMIALDTVNQISPTTRLSGKYLLGLLNSKLMNWYMYRFVYGRAIRTMHFDATSTDRLPIAPIDCSSRAGREKHAAVAGIVDRLLEATRAADASTMATRNVAGNKLAALSGRLDALVYDLYGLTPEEIVLIENASP